MKSALILVITCLTLSQIVLTAGPNFQKGLDILEGKGITDIKPLKNSEENVETFTFKDPDTGNTSFKAVAVLPMPYKHAMRLVEDMRLRQKWDSAIYDYETIEKMTGVEGRYSYYKVKMPVFFDNRDFVVESYRTETFEGYNLVVMSNSVKHPSKPEVKKYTRAEMSNSYVFVKSLGRAKTEISFLIGVDPKGKITPGIYDIFSKKVPLEQVQNMIKAYKTFKDLIVKEGDSWRNDQL